MFNQIELGQESYRIIQFLKCFLIVTHHSRFWEAMMNKHRLDPSGAQNPCRTRKLAIKCVPMLSEVLEQACFLRITPVLRSVTSHC